MRRERVLPRVVEFLLVGGATPLLFPLAWLLRRTLGLDTAELAVGFLCFHAAHVVNDPHFSVTYLLFYKDVKRRAVGDAWGAAQRIRYVVAGFVVPVVLVVWAGGALVARSAVALGWLIQLMFFLVGWHYVKQGFGVLTALSARNGVRFGTGERRAFLGHALAAWAYAWANPADPGTEMEERGVVFTTLPHGPALERVAFGLFALSAAIVAAMLVRRFKSTERFPPLAALLGYFSALWIWTVYSRAEPLVVYAIPALHSLQYLYFVWLLRSGDAHTTERQPFDSRSNVARLALFAVSAVGLAWLVFHGVPETLDAALFVPRGRRVDLGNLGAAPCVAAVFVCVNVHHYFMDAVIWRRENRQALARAADAGSPSNVNLSAYRALQAESSEHRRRPR
jgi:hypothetical protein